MRISPVAGALALLLISSVASAADPQPPAEPQTPIEIGSRLELLVDDYLIESISGGARLEMHHPVPQEIAIVHDAPWEGSGTGYHSIFQDGDRYRMYYKAWQLKVEDGKMISNTHPLFTCYAESRDGIHWEKPNLGLIEFEGSKNNNIVLASGKHGNVQIDAGHIAMFKDENPDCPAESQYKAFVLSRGEKGLLAFHSPDGLRWEPMHDSPVITKGAFDSQNLAFWDPARKEYRAYVRFFDNGRRDILTATSKDFITWTEPVPLIYPGAPADALYTNQVKPYYRAPHLLIGFPTRYTDRGWSPSMRELPELEHREQRAAAVQRYGTVVTEALLMTSRDGRTFHRWGEAFLRPGPQRPGTWNYGHQYIGWHVIETASPLPGAPTELSLFATESYWTGTSADLRRYTLRTDGFVSASAPLSGGEFVTKPLQFSGDQLHLNFSTSAAGSVQVEIQKPDGTPIPGYTMADCDETFGDELARTVTWKGKVGVGELAGQPVRLRFLLKDADVFAFQFK